MACNNNERLAALCFSARDCLITVRSVLTGLASRNESISPRREYIPLSRFVRHVSVQKLIVFLFNFGLGTSVHQCYNGEASSSKHEAASAIFCGEWVAIVPLVVIPQL